MTFHDSLVVEDAEQLAALRSPARLQIAMTIGRLKECAVSDISKEIGRSPSSVQYHVKEMVAKNLVICVGQRHANRRMERVYKLGGRDLEIDRENQSPDYVEALKDLYSAAFRHAERQMKQTLDDRMSMKSAINKRYGIVQTSTRMSVTALDKLNAKIRDIQQFLISNSGNSGADTVLVTIAMSTDHTTQ